MMIREQRLELGLTQREVAERTGLSVRTIRRAELEPEKVAEPTRMGILLAILTKEKMEQAIANEMANWLMPSAVFAICLLMVSLIGYVMWPVG